MMRGAMQMITSLWSSALIAACILITLQFGRAGAIDHEAPHFGTEHQKEILIKS